ncbi:MAG: TIGR00282 family metallophosphoesterase [Candidatus Brocadiia bacterium]
MRLKILVIGDIVGSPGREILKQKLPGILKAKRINFCIANGENVAGGSGITPLLAEELFSYGINVITTGDHIYKRKEIIPYLQTSLNILRPANYSPYAAGSGSGIYKTAGGVKIGVINLQGRVFMPPSECPFHTVDRLIKDISLQSKIIIVDIHAEATSEKIALGWYLDGKASLVFGTHTHIQTSDERVLPKGTAYITDVGMTGPYESVIGRNTENVLSAFITQMPTHFDVAENDVKLGGAVVTIDSKTGKALDIKRVLIKA